MNSKFFKQGEPFVWGTALSLSLILLLTGLLLFVVIANGITVFWPADVMQVTIKDGSVIAGEITRRKIDKNSGVERLQFKVGNRDLYGIDFKWVDAADITERSFPSNLFALERLEYGNFYGFLRQIQLPGRQEIVSTGDNPEQLLADALSVAETEKEKIEKQEDIIAALNIKLDKNQSAIAKLSHQKKTTEELQPYLDRQTQLNDEFSQTVAELEVIRREAAKYQAVFADASGKLKNISLLDIVRYCQPNSMSVFAKGSRYLVKVYELFTAEPRESNTEGGLFPAIFGTVMLIFLMSIFFFPLGVLAGLYLREYAKEGLLVKLVRIAVNNLAGIPSIVYGIFGLGFFVYGIGGRIDQLFFAERLPAPTFGTGGILWASLTLGLLTVPVVIVATEEALGSIPPGIREGSLALASTKFQTITKLLLPMASPGILTGFILAMARAAGEVAPLMITGVVKLAPALPIDGTFPYVHLDRKFMHLGFHIYDIGFQSPNVEAAMPMVYVTTLLLIAIVLVMTSTAIHLRNKMRKRYAVIDV